jgi:hypothetical protein
MVIHPGPHGARGAVVPRTTPGNLSIARVPRLPKESLAYDPW